MVLKNSEHDKQSALRDNFIRQFGIMCQNRKEKNELRVWNIGHVGHIMQLKSYELRKFSQVSHWTPARETLPLFLLYSELSLYAATLTLEQLMELIWVNANIICFFFESNSCINYRWALGRLDSIGGIFH